MKEIVRYDKTVMRMPVLQHGTVATVADYYSSVAYSVVLQLINIHDLNTPFHWVYSADRHFLAVRYFRLLSL